MKDFNIGEEIEILMGDDVLNFKCSSTHIEKASSTSGIITKKIF